MDLAFSRFRRSLAAGSIFLCIPLLYMSRSAAAQSEAQSQATPSDASSNALTAAGQNTTGGAGLGANSVAIPAPTLDSVSTGNFGPDPTPAVDATEPHDGGGSNHGPSGFGPQGRNGYRRGGDMGFSDPLSDTQSGFGMEDRAQGGMQMGSGRMGQGSMRQAGMSGGAMGQRGSGGGGGQGQLNLDSLFRIADQWTQAASRSVGSGSGLGTALNMLSRAERMRKSGFNLPLASSVGRFNFGYQESFGHGSNAMGGEIGQGSAQASFNSHAFRNDLLHFSATANFGGMGIGGEGGGATSFNQGNGGSGRGSGERESEEGSGGGHGFGSMPPPSGGMSGMNMGNGGNRRSGTTAGPTVSLKLSF